MKSESAEQTWFQIAVAALCFTVVGLAMIALMSVGALSGFTAASKDALFTTVSTMTGLCLLAAAVATGGYVHAVRKAEGRTAARGGRNPAET